MAAPCLVKIQSAFEQRPEWLSSFFCRRDRWSRNREWKSEIALPLLENAVSCVVLLPGGETGVISPGRRKMAEKGCVLPRRHGLLLDHIEKIQRNLADILFFLIMKYNNGNIPCVRDKYFTNKGLENKPFYFFKIMLYRDGFEEELTLRASFYCSSPAAMF